MPGAPLPMGLPSIVTTGMTVLVAEVTKASRAAGRKTELYFFYAGHGSLTAEREGSVNLLDGVLRRRELFRAVLDPVPADFKHVIIDACDAYFMVARRGGTPSAAEEAAVKGFLDQEALDAHPEVGVLVSGSSEVETHEWSGLEAGVFSHEVRSALLGGADADGDGLLRYAEVAAFVSAANEGLSDPRARVRVFARPPPLDLSHPMTDLRRGPRRLLELAPSARGLVRVEDARGARYADVHVSGEAPVYLRLVGDDEYYVFRGEGEARVPAGLAGVLAVAESAFGTLRRRPRGPVEDDLRRGLFSVPYGLGFLRGFVSRDPSLGALQPPAERFPDVTWLRTEVSTPPPRTLMRRAGWLGVGTAALCGAGSALSAVLARGSYDTFLERLSSQGTFDPSQVRAVENWRLATNLLLAAAATFGATGVLLLWLSDSSTSGAQVAVTVGPQPGLRVEF